MSADLLFSAVVGRRYNSKSQLHASEGRASQRGKTKHLCVMFVRQIVDPAEDRPVWINFVLRGKVDEAVISMSKFGPPKFNSSRAFANFASIVVR